MKRKDIHRLHRDVDQAVAGLSRSVDALVTAADELIELAKCADAEAAAASQRAASARLLAEGAIRRADKIQDLIS